MWPMAAGQDNKPAGTEAEAVSCCSPAAVLSTAEATFSCADESECCCAAAPTGLAASAVGNRSVACSPAQVGYVLSGMTSPELNSPAGVAATLGDATRSAHAAHQSGTLLANSAALQSLSPDAFIPVNARLWSPVAGTHAGGRYAGRWSHRRCSVQTPMASASAGVLAAGPTWAERSTGMGSKFCRRLLGRLPGPDCWAISSSETDRTTGTGISDFGVLALEAFAAAKNSASAHHSH